MKPMIKNQCDLTRRTMLAASASTLALTPAAVAVQARAPAAPRSILGIGSSSYTVAWKARAGEGFTQPDQFLAFCHERGGAGIQCPLGRRSPEDAHALRDLAEGWGMYVEGSVRLPGDPADLDRFSEEIRTARDCGATVTRAVLHGGRRYEIFQRAEQFLAFRSSAEQSLKLALPVLKRWKIRLAIENHKDLRTTELIELIRGLGDEHLGICFDTGNDFALLEHPEITVKALAPWVISCHFKDMAVEMDETTDGFWLAEVPLGQGSLDLAMILDTLRAANPGLRLNLEMITRDPLWIPCLSDRYWTTLEKLPGQELARCLRWVRHHIKPLPRVGKLPIDRQLAIEDENARRSLDYARDRFHIKI